MITNEDKAEEILKDYNTTQFYNDGTHDVYTESAVLYMLNEMARWKEQQIQSETSNYNPYKEIVKSILIMVEEYAKPSSDLQDFYNNVKVKCKDAIEYDKIFFEKQGEQKLFDYENANIPQKDFAPKAEPKFKVGDIYKIDVPECSNYTYEVGTKGVIKIEQDIIQTGVGDGYNTSKLIYRIIFDDERKIEISADVKGIVIFRKNVEFAESEDEKIKEGLIKYLKTDMECNPSQCESFYNKSIAWLEKQCEHNTAITKKNSKKN